MANTIKHKRSSTASAVPAALDLVAGEIAINTTDEKLYIKNTGGTVVEIGGGGGGGVANPMTADLITGTAYNPSPSGPDHFAIRTPDTTGDGAGGPYDFSGASAPIEIIAGSNTYLGDLSAGFVFSGNVNITSGGVAGTAAFTAPGTRNLDPGAGAVSNITLQGGDSTGAAGTTAQDAGGVLLLGGTADSTLSSPNQRGGTIWLKGGESKGSYQDHNNSGGECRLEGGYSQYSYGGRIHITGGISDQSKGGDIDIEGGYASAGTGNGGNVTITGGSTTGGTAGKVILQSTNLIEVNGTMDISGDLDVTGAVEITQGGTNTALTSDARILVQHSIASFQGVFAQVTGSNAIGLRGDANTGANVGIGVSGQTTSTATGAAAVSGAATGISGDPVGVRGSCWSAAGLAGFFNNAASAHDVDVELCTGSTSGIPIRALYDSTEVFKVENNGDVTAAGNVVSNIEIVADATATRNLVLADSGTLVTMTSASANTVQIPANASVAFPIGTQILVTQMGAGTTTIAITTDTLVSAGGLTDLAGQYSTGTLIKTAATTWLLAGDLA